MITVTIPKEINDYEEKILFGLSLRKLIAVSIAIVFGGLAYFIFGLIGIPKDLKGYFLLIFVVPILAEGFVKINGFHFSKYVFYILRHKLMSTKLTYTALPLVDLMKTSESEELIEDKGNESQTIQNKRRKAISERTESETLRTKKNRKEALRSIKTARKEFKRLQQDAIKRNKT